MRGHAVVPVGGADVLGALLVQLAEVAVGAQPGGDLGVAPPGQLGDGGAPGAGVAEQLRAEEHPPDIHPALLQPPGRLHGERGARRLAPQQDPGQARRLISSATCSATCSSGANGSLSAARS